MKLNLVGVQARMTLDDYACGEAFRRKIGALMEQAVRAADPDWPTLVVFPEAIGLYLSLVPFHYRRLAGATSLAAAARALLPVMPRWAWQALCRGRLSPAVIALEHAVEAEAIYRETFSELSALYRVYVVAGSAYLPYVDHDPIGGSRMLSRRAQNTTYTFGPTGAVLGRTHKVHFAPGLEAKLGLTAGTPEALQPVRTAIGNIGVLICMDGFYRSLWERLDGLGAHVLAMPSYEMSRWEQRSWLDPQITQGEQWLRDGMPLLIQGRENIRYGVNAMLVGDVLGLWAEGRTTICANTGDPRPWPPDAIIAMAPDPAGEAVVAACVEAPWLAEAVAPSVTRRARA